ncbi:MAG: zinc chelation protein SecC [Methanophagales archaeon ANME-1-THS]|nr:MAG: zinc chelation protein SecC [Methanophagales archaeon ANME-1-THS]
MRFRRQAPRMYHWSIEEVETLSTKEIIRKLRGFGVDFKRSQFLEDVKRFYSASDLADHWVRIYPITAEWFDEDFIWMAAIVLWRRLAPDVINSEQLDEMMQRGYDLKRERRIKECCNKESQIREHLKKRFSPDMKSIENAESVFTGMQSLFNWCQDLELELGNAGSEDTIFYEKRIEYCREFYRMLPDTSSLVIKNMKRAEAESYFFLGEKEKGDAAFKKIIEEFPESAWGYIGWGDMYWLFSRNDELPRLDYDNAEKIYRMGLAKATSDKRVILDRLRDLEEEKKKVMR